jgi:hypothetical protein
MIIAAHIEPSNDNSSFLLEYISRLASQQPQDLFIIFSDKEIKSLSGLSDNCFQIIVKPVIKSSLLLHYWYNVKLPPLLIKYNTDVFISENSVGCLRTTTPQVMIIKDDFLKSKKYPVKNSYSRYLNRFFANFATKATAVCFTKAFLGQQLFARYPSLKPKSTTILHGVDKAYQSINDKAKELLRAKYTEGHEYFVSECSQLTQPQMITLLKAFSIFKKRLKSGIQLVLINKMGENPIKDFHIYKYRQEVQIIPFESKTQEAGILAAAYAAVYLPSAMTANDWGLQCMHCGIPLICLEYENSHTIYDDAAILTTSDEKKIAEYLMLLYKDEAFKEIYIKRGIELAGLYNWEDSTTRLWQTILQCSRV